MFPKVARSNIHSAFLFKFHLLFANPTVPRSTTDLCTARFYRKMSSNRDPTSELSQNASVRPDPVLERDSAQPSSEEPRLFQGRGGQWRGRGRGRAGRRENGRGRGRGQGRGRARQSQNAATSEPRSPRLFLGIELPEDVRMNLSTLQTEGLGMTRTLPKQSYHITLHFLGHTDLQRLSDVLSEAVRKKSKVMPHAFDARIRGVGAFPEPKDESARVLWAGIEPPCAELIQLYSVLKEGLSEGGYKVEDRPFTPHVTIARRDPRHWQRRQKKEEQRKPNGDEEKDEDVEVARRTVSIWAENYRETDFGPVEIKEFVIYESVILGQSDPMYKVRARYELPQ